MLDMAGNVLPRPVLLFCMGIFSEILILSYPGFNVKEWNDILFHAISLTLNEEYEII
jgi:hypothetical protein